MLRRKSSILLLTTCVLVGLLMGQGCPAPQPPPETYGQKAYRICGDLGFTSDDTSTLMSMAAADFQNGYTYGEEVSAASLGCNDGCQLSYLDNCNSRCYNCGVAIVNAVYYGKDAPAQKGLEAVKLSKPAAVSELQKALAANRLQ